MKAQVGKALQKQLARKNSASAKPSLKPGSRNVAPLTKKKSAATKMKTEKSELLAINRSKTKQSSANRETKDMRSRYSDPPQTSSIKSSSEIQMKIEIRKPRNQISQKNEREVSASLFGRKDIIPALSKQFDSENQETLSIVSDNDPKESQFDDKLSKIDSQNRIPASQTSKIETPDLGRRFSKNTGIDFKLTSRKSYGSENSDGYSKSAENEIPDISRKSEFENKQNKPKIEMSKFDSESKGKKDNLKKRRNTVAPSDKLQLEKYFASQESDEIQNYFPNSQQSDSQSEESQKSPEIPKKSKKTQKVKNQNQKLLKRSVSNSRNLNSGKKQLLQKKSSILSKKSQKSKLPPKSISSGKKLSKSKTKKAKTIEIQVAESTTNEMEVLSESYQFSREESDRISNSSQQFEDKPNLPRLSEIPENMEDSQRQEHQNDEMNNFGKYHVLTKLVFKQHPDMTIQQIQEFQDAISLFDKNDDGPIDIKTKELGIVLRSMGLHPAPDEIEVIIQEFKNDIAREKMKEQIIHFENENAKNERNEILRDLPESSGRNLPEISQINSQQKSKFSQNRQSFSKQKSQEDIEIEELEKTIGGYHQDEINQEFSTDIMRLKIGEMKIRIEENELQQQKICDPYVKTLAEQEKQISKMQNHLSKIKAQLVKTENQSTEMRDKITKIKDFQESMTFQINEAQIGILSLKEKNENEKQGEIEIELQVKQERIKNRTQVEQMGQLSGFIAEKQVEYDKIQIKRDSKWDAFNQDQPNLRYLDDKNALLSNKYRLTNGELQSKSSELKALQNHVKSIQDEVEAAIGYNDRLNRDQIDMIQNLKDEQITNKNNLEIKFQGLQQKLKEKMSIEKQVQNQLQAILDDNEYFQNHVDRKTKDKEVLMNKDKSLRFVNKQIQQRLDGVIERDQAMSDRLQVRNQECVDKLSKPLPKIIGEQMINEIREKSQDKLLVNQKNFELREKIHQNEVHKQRSQPLRSKSPKKRESDFAGKYSFGRCQTEPDEIKIEDQKEQIGVANPFQTQAYERIDQKLGNLQLKLSDSIQKHTSSVPTLISPMSHAEKVQAALSERSANIRKNIIEQTGQAVAQTSAILKRPSPKAHSNFAKKYGQELLEVISQNQKVPPSSSRLQLREPKFVREKMISDEFQARNSENENQEIKSQFAKKYYENQAKQPQVKQNETSTSPQEPQISASSKLLKKLQNIDVIQEDLEEQKSQSQFINNSQMHSEIFAQGHYYHEKSGLSGTFERAAPEEMEELGNGEFRDTQSDDMNLGQKSMQFTSKFGRQMSFGVNNQ